MMAFRWVNNSFAEGGGGGGAEGSTHASLPAPHPRIPVLWKSGSYD